MPTQRVQGMRWIQNWSDNPRELKRQLHEFENNLRSFFAAGGFDIINGNLTPPKLMPQQGALQVQGTAVALSAQRGRNVAEIGYAGVDGVDTERGKVRASRDIITGAISGDEDDYTPAGWGTCDYLVIGPWSPPVTRNITGFAAPGADDTKSKIVLNTATSTIILTNQDANSAEANRIIGPNQADVSLFRGEAVQIDYIDSMKRWQVIGRHDWQSIIDALDMGVTDHGDLDGLGDPNDHTWALLVNGSRPLGGNWSLGGFNLTNVSNLTATGTPTWNINNGFFVNVDSAAFNGSGSAVTGLQSLTMHTSGAIADFNGGSIEDLGAAVFDGNGSFISGVDSIGLHDSGSIIGFAGGDGIDIGSLRFDGANRDVTAAAAGDLRVTGNAIELPYLTVRSAGGARIAVARTRSTGLSSGSTIDIDVNMTNVGGLNFTNRPVVFTVTIFSFRAASTAYGSQFVRSHFFVHYSGAGIEITDIYYDNPLSADAFVGSMRATGGVSSKQLDAFYQSANTVRIRGTVSDRIAEMWVFAEGAL